MIIYGDQNIEVPNYTHFGKYMLDHIRQANSNDVCLENGVTKEKLTYKEAIQYAVNLSTALSALGVKRGDVVAIGSEAFLHYVPTALAITFSGAAYTPLELEIGRAMLEHKLGLVKPKYFICSVLFYKAYKDILNNYGCIETCIAVSEMPGFSYSLKSLAAVNVPIESFEPTEVQGMSDTVVILYSSGTTGMPKGVEITHFSCILTSLPDPFENFPLLQTAFMGGPGPWFGNLFVFMTYKFLVLGRKVVFSSDMSIDTTLPIFKDCKVDVLFTLPMYIRQILCCGKQINEYVDSIKMIYSRSSPLGEHTIDRFKERFPKVNNIIQAMGLTECGEPMSEIWAPKHKPGSVGLVSPNVQVKVVDPNTRAILGPNDRGEICVKGPMLMKGYLDIHHFDYFDDDGFYKTGDLGYFDDEQYFYIIDRLTDIINTGGTKVSPVAVENILLKHPGVLDAAVVGKSDPLLAEVCMAFVVKKPGCDIIEKDLIEHVAFEVPSHMQLKGGVIFIPQLPRNQRGKILRRKLREMLL